jgi:lauroyl/myristoyl acyltransferase
MPVESLLRRIRPGSAFWRRLLRAGVRHGPDAWIRYSPPAIGLIFWAALGKPRRNVVATLARVRGPRSRARDLVDSARVFANFASSLTESFVVGAGRGYETKVRSANDGRDFKTSQAEGRGVILATAHTAGWDVAGPVLRTRQSAEVVIVMERERDPDARRMHDEARARAGVRVVHAGHDPLAALPLLQHLRKQGLVAMKFDRTAPGMRVRKVTFLGAPWEIPEGILTLAALSGAPIVPVFTRRLGFLEYEFVTSPPLHVSRRPSAEELDRVAQKLADLLAQFARENPEQWFRWG